MEHAAPGAQYLITASRECAPEGTRREAFEDKPCRFGAKIELLPIAEKVRTSVEDPPPKRAHEAKACQTSAGPLTLMSKPEQSLMWFRPRQGVHAHHGEVHRMWRSDVLGVQSDDRCCCRSQFASD